jgi:hypothetical protein
MKHPLHQAQPRGARAHHSQQLLQPQQQQQQQQQTLSRTQLKHMQAPTCNRLQLLSSRGWCHLGAQQQHQVSLLLMWAMMIFAGFLLLATPLLQPAAGAQ